MTKRNLWTAVGLSILCITGIKLLTAQEPSGSETRAKLRVGVYNSRSVATAYYRSKFDTPAEELHREAKQAEEQGDQELLENVKQKALAQQNLQHMQVFGNAPIHNILKHLEKPLQQQARAQRLDLIVRDIDIAYQGDGVVVVDITGVLIDACAPTPQTLKTIKQLQNHKPVPLEQFPLKHGK